MSLYLKITVPPWADRSLRLQARGTARARSVKVPNSEGRPRHAQGSLTIGTGTPNHMMGVPGRACARACQAHGTDKARPGQSLVLIPAGDWEDDIKSDSSIRKMKRELIVHISKEKE